MRAEGSIEIKAAPEKVWPFLVDDEILEEVGLPFGVLGKLIGLFGARGSEATVKVMLEKLKGLAEGSIKG